MKVTWGLVPFDGRNGIIRVYVIYYKLQGAPESEWRYVKASASVNSTLIFRLKYWSFYEIKVAAKTVSEGVKSSAVVARTDEHGEENEYDDSFTFNGNFSLCLF